MQLCLAIGKAITRQNEDSDDWIAFTLPEEMSHSGELPSISHLLTFFLLRGSTPTQRDLSTALTTGGLKRGKANSGVYYYKVNGEDVEGAVEKFNPHASSSKASPPYTHLILVSREETLTSNLIEALKPHQECLTLNALATYKDPTKLVDELQRLVTSVSFKACAKPTPKPSSSSSSSCAAANVTPEATGGKTRKRMLDPASEAKENAHVAAAEQAGKVVLGNPRTTDMMIKVRATQT